MYLFVWNLVVNSLLSIDATYTNIGDSFMHKPWKFVNNIIISYNATGHCNRINTNYANLRPNSTVSIVDFETLGKISIDAESVWLIIIIHSFALTQAKKILESNWTVIRRFCSIVDIFIAKSQDEALHHLKSYFNRLCVLATIWDSPGDGLECLLQLISEHTYHVSTAQQLCPFHGSTPSSCCFPTVNCTDKMKEQRNDQNLVAIVRALVDKCYSNSVISTEHLNDTMITLVTMLFEQCNYGDFTNNSYYCSSCHCTWSYAILFREGVRKYLSACISTTTSCNSSKGTDSLIGKRLKVACTRQDGLLRLLQKNLNDTSFYQWSVLGLLIAEVTTIFGCNIFDDQNQDSKFPHKSMGSWISKNQILNKLLTVNTLQESQLTCLLWLLCGLSFSPFIKKDINCMQSPLLDLTQAEFYRVCNDINVQISEEAPFFAMNICPNNLLFNMPSKVTNNLISIIVITSLTLTISNVSDIAVENNNGCSQVTINDMLPFRLLLGSSIICNLSVFGPSKGIHSAISLLSISVAFINLQIVGRVLANTVSQLLSEMEHVKNVLIQLDNIVQASISLILPLFRAPINSLLNLGIESSNNFCFAMDNYEDTTSFIPYILVKSLSQLVISLCWQKCCNNIETRRTFTSTDNSKSLSPIELINLIEPILSGSMRYQDTSLSIIPSWLHCLLWQPLLELIANHVKYIQGVPLENESNNYLFIIKYFYEIIITRTNGYLFSRFIFDTWTCVMATTLSQPLISAVICFPSFHNNLSIICQYLSTDSHIYMNSNLLDSRIVKLFNTVPMITESLSTPQSKHLLQSVYTSLRDLHKSPSNSSCTLLKSLVLSSITTSNSDLYTPISLGNIFIRCSRHVLLCAFRAYDHDRFNLLKHSHYIRSLLASLVQSISFTRNSNAFERRDIIECINTVLINDFANSGTLNCIRTIVSTQNIAINQQETSLYILSLPLFIRCIPVLAFSTRQLEWEALLQIFIVACNKFAQHYNVTLDKSNIEILQFYRSNVTNTYVPIEIKLILIWCIGLVLSFNDDTQSFMNKLELFKNSSKCSTNFKQLMISILPLLKVFVEYNFISHISSSYAKDNDTDNCEDDRLRQLCRYLLLYDKPWNDCEILLNNYTLSTRSKQRFVNRNNDSSIVGTIPAAIINSRIFLNIHVNSTRIIFNHIHPLAKNYSIHEDEMITLLCCATISSIKIMRVLLGESPAHVDSSTNNFVDIINVNTILLATTIDCIHSNIYQNVDIIESTNSIIKPIITLLSFMVNTSISNIVNNDHVASDVITNSYKVISSICKIYNCPECDQVLLVTSKEQYTKRCTSSVCLLCHGGTLHIISHNIYYSVYYITNLILLGAYIKELITQTNNLSRNHSTNISSKIYYRQLELIPIKMYILKDQINHILLSLSI